MKKVKTMVALTVVILLCATMLMACGQPAQQETNTEPTQTVEASAGASESAAQGTGTADGNAEDVSLYFILKTFSNPFHVAIADAIKAEAEAQGVTVFVDAMNSEDEATPQLDKLMTAVNSDYDGVGVGPISATNLVEGIAAASEKGIPVVDLDEPIDEAGLEASGGYLAAFITTDNKDVGKKGAQYIIDQIGADGGKVAIIEGKAGSAAGEDRKAGATEAFESAEGIELVDSQPADWDRNRALDVATNILSQNPDLKGFYCCNDTMALGVQEAVENSGLEGKCIVVGTDGLDEAYDSIRAGKMAATVAQDPAMIGKTAFEKLLQSVRDGNAGTKGQAPEPTYIDSILYTKDNLK